MNAPEAREVDCQYQSWKSWDAGHFGQPTLENRRYFDAEFKGFALGDGLSVLEVGFGNGEFLGYCKQLGCEVLGTETNLSLVRLANERGFRAVHADQLSNIRDNSFDLIVAIDVLEHIPNDEVVVFLQNLSNKLKPAGSIWARFPNGDSPLGLPNQNGDPTHVNSIGAGKIRCYSDFAGLRLVCLKKEALPINIANPAQAIRRLVSRMFSVVFERLFKTLFLPYKPDVVLFSENLVAVIKLPQR